MVHVAKQLSAMRILEEGEAVETEVAEQSASLRGLIRVAAPMIVIDGHVRRVR